MIEQPFGISMAISCMWAWMIPHFYIEFTEHRLALEKVSASWRQASADGEASPRQLANRATLVGASWALGIIAVVYTGSAVAVALLTRDPVSTQESLTKPVAMAIGVGRMLSAGLLAYFSVEIPRWLGVTYSSHKLVMCYKQMPLRASAQSHRELSFRVSWSLLGHFFTMYPLLLAYFCQESIGHVALSTGVGTAFGFAVVYLVWLGHTKLRSSTRTCIAIVTSGIITVSSAAAFSAGCWYVRVVWYDRTNYTNVYTMATFLVWLVLCCCVHGVEYRLTRRKLAEAAAVIDETTVAGDVSEAARDASHKGDWRFHSQVFEPPRSIQCGGSKHPRLGRTHRSQDSPQDEILSRVSEDDNHDVENNCGKDDAPGDIEGNVELVPSTSKFDTKQQDDVVQAQRDDSSNDEVVSLSKKEESSLSQIPTLWFMVKVNSCCRRRKYYEAPRRKKWNILASMIKWTLWALLCGWHLAFCVVNIGASHQQTIVRGALQATYKSLYPEDYNTGAMCAWDEASPNANIKTFASMEDVIDANYTVIHCGKCGQCSNWNDLSLQWTTRDHLAQKAKDCVTKSILGSRETVQNCNENSIGFTKECSLCWTTDEYCARDQCMFIFLQSVFTNQVNNFNVGPEDITTATCDEALCGPAFVPCSGATRRRMNIVSEIPRPDSQQCDVASEDWSSVFGHP